MSVCEKKSKKENEVSHVVNSGNLELKIKRLRKEEEKERKTEVRLKPFI